MSRKLICYSNKTDPKSQANNSLLSTQGSGPLSKSPGCNPTFVGRRHCNGPPGTPAGNCEYVTGLKPDIVIFFTNSCRPIIQRPAQNGRKNRAFFRPISHSRGQFSRRERRCRIGKTLRHCALAGRRGPPVGQARQMRTAPPDMTTWIGVSVNMKASWAPSGSADSSAIIRPISLCRTARVSAGSNWPARRIMR